MASCVPTAEHGIVGAVFDEHGVFVTSPNLEFIPPPLQGSRSIRMRKDWHFGEEDPVYFPQPFSTRVGHLACIPNPSTDISNPHRIAWQVPSAGDFIPFSPSSTAQGLGLISNQLASKMKAAADAAVYRVYLEAKDSTTETVESFKKDLFLRNYTFSLKYLCARLQSPASLQEVFMTFSLCQHVYLELVARTSWLARYAKLVADPPKYPVPEVANVVGALTDHEEVAERLYLSGIPVWLVRPILKKDSFKVNKWLAPKFDGMTRVLRDPGLSLNLEDETPCREVVFERKLGSLDRYAAMSRYIRRFTTTNVFMDEDAAGYKACVPSSAGPTRTPKLNKTHPTYSKGKGKKLAVARENDRNKFIDIASPMTPPSLSQWSRASAAAGDGFDPNTPCPTGRDNGYALPDPGVIVGTGNEDTRTAFFTTWLRLRAVLLYRLLSPKFRPMRTKHWRGVLGVGIHGLKADTRAAERRLEQQRMLQECLNAGGMQGSVDLSKLDSTPVQWRELSLDQSVHPPLPVAREIICELYEINFRYELISLDRFCYQTDASVAEREQEVLGVLFHFNNRLVPDAADLGKTGFASTQKNERRRALHGLHEVMQGWNGGPGELPERLRDPGVSKRLDIAETDDIPVMEMDSIEYALAFHYVSTFRIIFARAPLLPHRV
ncbi:hypothetical protein V5O48_008147 [Marasmius crinis-equi]|uniref:Uncharacterized protein n=1 Tax=Marasmius crinis-equi TaxID=585013 RepID=A0ABR3FEQ1_9AGAR